MRKLRNPLWMATAPVEETVCLPEAALCPAGESDFRPDQ
jgi:transposase